VWIQGAALDSQYGEALGAEEEALVVQLEEALGHVAHGLLLLL
jgi:hypothetical protein